MPTDNATQVTSTTTLVTTAETTAITVGAPRQPMAASAVASAGAPTGVRIRGLLVVTTGTTVTALVVRIRQGSLTGAVVTTFTIAAGASVVGVAVPFDAIDSSAAALPLTGLEYFVTVSQTGAGTNGSVTFAIAETSVVSASVV